MTATRRVMSWVLLLATESALRRGVWRDEIKVISNASFDG